MLNMYMHTNAQVLEETGIRVVFEGIIAFREQHKAGVEVSSYMVVCVCVSVYLCVSVCLSVCFYLSVCMYVCMSVCLSVCPSIRKMCSNKSRSRLLIHTYIYTNIHTYIYYLCAAKNGHLLLVQSASPQLRYRDTRKRDRCCKMDASRRIWYVAYACVNMHVYMYVHT